MKLLIRLIIEAFVIYMVYQDTGSMWLVLALVLITIAVEGTDYSFNQLNQTAKGLQHSLAEIKLLVVKRDINKGH